MGKKLKVCGYYTFMQNQNGGEKRKFPHLRRLIDGAKPLEKAALRAMARLLPPDQLRPVDDALGRLSEKKPDDGNQGGPGGE